MEELKINDVNGNTFVVNLENGHYQVKKVTENGLEDANEEELAYVGKEIQKMKASNNTYDEIISLIKNMIKNGEIKTYDELRDFIASSTLSDEEKNRLLQNGISELNIQDIVDLKNRIIDCIRNKQSDELASFINFKVQNNAFGSKYCEIKVGYSDKESVFEQINETLNYTDTLKKELIEPVVFEVALKGMITNNDVERSSDTIDNLGNYNLRTNKNSQVNLINTEYDYADELRKRCENLKSRYPVEGDSERDEAVENLQNDYYQEENKMGEYRTDEQGFVYDKDNKLVGKVKERGQARKLIKKENGFSLTLIIFAICSLITSLLVLFQIFILG